MPIRAILEAEHDPLFGPAEIAALTAAFDAALRKLEFVDRHDPAAIAVAKLIVIAARKGERDPSRLCTSRRARSRCSPSRSITIPRAQRRGCLAAPAVTAITKVRRGASAPASGQQLASFR